MRSQLIQASPGLQPKLLRALEKREVQSLGSDQVVPVNVRVIAATNRDLRGMVRQGTFRRDLYYRLAGVEVFLPPLRERREDIPLLVRHFLEECGQKERSVTPAALTKLTEADWPGNARELRNAVERAVALAPDRPIDTADILLAPDPAAPESAPGNRTLEDVEAEAILATLKRTGWNRSQAARVLGITRGTLAEKIQRYKLQE